MFSAELEFGRQAPYAWLRSVLTELPRRPPDHDIEDLMPFNLAERAPHPNTC